MSTKIKICKDLNCLATTYNCSRCKAICYRHFFSSSGLCGDCIVKARVRKKEKEVLEGLERGLTRCWNENCQLVILKVLAEIVDGKEYCKTCFGQIEFDKVDHMEIEIDVEIEVEKDA